MNYELNNEKQKRKLTTKEAVRAFWPLISGERNIFFFAVLATLSNALVTLTAPLIVAHVIDTYITEKQFSGVITFGFVLFGLYLVGLFTSYAQTRLMGGMGQRILFGLRNRIFQKLQELPVAFFNDNKAGDLISRINNDTDKLNQFFSQTLVQFMGSLFLMFGSAVFLLSINLKLGVAILSPAIFLLVLTRLLSPWVKRSNANALQSTGGLSAEISESLANFRVVVAFNRRDFFRDRFEKANQNNFKSAVYAGIANNTFFPIFGFASVIAQLIMLSYGIHLIIQGEFTIGLLIGYFSYSSNFYSPLRQLANMWSNFQVALAGWDRISTMLNVQNEMPVTIPSNETDVSNADAPILEFRSVDFGYTETVVLHDVNFSLTPGKTYALVGPTGGGKTTTASLMARLYDPSQGQIFFQGRDIRTLQPEERTKKIGFILQEPVLFSGTIRENLLYGNEEYLNISEEELHGVLKRVGLEKLLTRFTGGLDAQVSSSGDEISLGQKQLIAFMRAVLREPELLILDEATANIDTVTEKLLEDIVRNLPKHTTRVIIAHRLNTIENADEIFFVNGGAITEAGSLEHAMDLLLHHDSES